MNFKFVPLLLIASNASAFVHIHKLKPRLPVDPERRDIVFHWNGAYPNLKDKEKVLNGAFAEASDRVLMEELLHAAVRVWTDVPTAYVELVVIEDAAAVLDTDDEVFSIVVEEQDSKLVAAAALPNFISSDPNPSDLERDEHIIHDCDISVSDSSVEAKSLLRTLVHEMGHCLGLGHPHSNYHSIMSYSGLDQSATLALDDEAGVSFLYPEPGESQEVKNITCGRVGSATGQGSFPWPVYALLALPIFLRRRPRGA